MFQVGTVSLTATALNLFGPPATNRTYEMESQLKRKGFTAKGFPEYSFDIPAETTFERETRQGVTNEQGQATEQFVLAAGLKDIGVLEGKIYVTVFDENGRPVNRLQRLMFTLSLYFTGYDCPIFMWVPMLHYQLILWALTEKESLQNGATAQVEVVRIEYQTVVEKKYDQLRYTSRKNEKLVYSNKLTLAGRKRYVPICAHGVSGEYEVRVRRPGAEHYTLSRIFMLMATVTRNILLSK
jgi:uncharacterized protein YfaS (alpha-2-macroglobulin family)